MVGSEYLEAASVLVFVSVALSRFVFENFDGFILNTYSQESSLRLMSISAFCLFIAAVFFVSGWILYSKRHIVAHSGDDKEEDGYTQQAAREQDEEGHTGLA